ncbi:MAG: universal stress protein [Daejeonella sp.]
MKNILIPTDFSTCSNNAIDFAVQTAKRLPVQLTIMHAFELMGNVYIDYMGVNREFNDAQLDDVYKRLDEIKNRIKTEHGIEVTAFVENGRVEHSIHKAVKEKDIDLIIMGTKGAKGIQEKLWGSETGSVIESSKIPVLTIPQDYTFKEPNNIVLALNKIEEDVNSLDVLFEITDFFNSHVDVVLFTDEENGGQAYLEHSREIPRFENILKNHYQEETLTVSHLYGQKFDHSLQNFITDNKVDMLAMIKHKRNFLENLFHSSKTKRMSYHTNIPLLVIPDK